MGTHQGARSTSLRGAWCNLDKNRRTPTQEEQNLWLVTYRYIGSVAAIALRYSNKYRNQLSQEEFLKGVAAGLLLIAKAIKRYKLAGGDEAGHNEGEGNDDSDTPED